MVTDSFRMNWKMANLGKPYAAFMDGIVSEYSAVLLF